MSLINNNRNQSGGSASATATFTPPQVSINSLSVNESTANATFTVSLSGVSTRDATVHWQTSNGTATAGSEYTTSSGDLTIPAGSPSGTINVPLIHNPAVCAGNKDFSVTLSAPVDATISGPTGTATVQEVDFPTVSIGDVTIAEGLIASLPVTLSQACSSTAITVNYASANGTATAGSHYLSTSGSLNIPAGTTQVLLPVTTLDDTNAVNNETFTVQLSSPSVGSLATSTGTVTLQDYDDRNFSPTTLATSTSVGGSTACAILNGAALCWGVNDTGQLGDGTTTSTTYPVAVSGLSTGVTKISVGAYAGTASTAGHVCAIVGGSAKCWGNNSSGALGTVPGHSSVPLQVIGLTSGVTDISAGSGQNTCAVVSGGAKCWGANAQGQVGNGNTTNQSNAVDVSGLTSGVAAISAGTFHACALMSAGGVKCWGGNGSGQLGNGTTTPSLTPVDVTGISSATKLAVGYNFTCALDGGAVKCWGINNAGQLGNGTGIDSSTPVPVTGLGSGVLDIAAGGETGWGVGTACALLTNGTIQCWGNNVFAGMGNGVSGGYYYTPTTVSGITNATSISIGGVSACATLSTGSVRCWGSGIDGQRANGIFNYLRRVRDNILTTGVTQFSMGSRAHSCATVNGGAKCWGGNSYGQLGDGTTTNRWSPVSVTGLSSGVTKVTANGDNFAGYDSHSCALVNGGVKCWGRNTWGQLGDNSITDRFTPVDVSGLTSGVTDVEAGPRHTCAIVAAGAVKCWGVNNMGQLGNNSTTYSPVPVDVVGITGATQLALTYGSSCAIVTGGAIKCWGYNDVGQLGDGTTSTSLVPVNVTGVTGATSISGNGFDSAFFCAVISGAAKCWGNGGYSRLGNGSGSNQSAPTQVTGLTSGIVSVSTMAMGGCAITTAGAAKCWGNNPYGEVGSGGGGALTPVDVLGLQSGVLASDGGYYANCFLVKGGGIKCAGAASESGLGWTPVPLTSTEVLFP